MFYQLSKDIAHKQTLMITINRMIKDKYDTSEITEIYLDLISKVIESLIEERLGVMVLFILFILF
jgi:hypothetical protein